MRKIVGYMMVMVGGVMGVGGLFGVWPLAFGIDIQEHLIGGFFLNIVCIVAGALVLGFGAKVGDL